MRVSSNLRAVFVSSLLLALAACGGGSGSGSEKPTSNNGKSSATANSSRQAQPGILSWSHPNARANGEYLELDEIGGYEIRYQVSNKGDYIYLQLSGLVTQLPLTGLPDNANFEIAVYDTQGLYSDYVPIQPH